MRQDSKHQKWEKILFCLFVCLEEGEAKREKQAVGKRARRPHRARRMLTFSGEFPGHILHGRDGDLIGWQGLKYLGPHYQPNQRPGWG